MADILIKTRVEGGKETIRTISDMRKEMRELRGQMATASEEEFVKLSQRASKLNADMDRANNTITRSGSVFTNFNTTLSRTARNLITLDFGAAADSARMLQIQAKQLTFKELNTGLRQAAGAFRGLTVAMLSNPLFLLGAVLGGIGIALFQLRDDLVFVQVAFDAVGAAVDFVTELFKRFTDQLGLTQFETRKTIQEQIDLQRNLRTEWQTTTNEIVDNLNRQIAIQRALQLETVDLENRLLITRRNNLIQNLNSINIEITNLTRLSQIKKRLSDEEKTQLEELKTKTKEIKSEIVKIDQESFELRLKENRQFWDKIDEREKRTLDSRRDLQRLQNEITLKNLRDIDTAFTRRDAALIKLNQTQIELEKEINDKLSTQGRLKRQVSREEQLARNQILKLTDEEIKLQNELNRVTEDFNRFQSTSAENINTTVKRRLEVTQAYQSEISMLEDELNKKALEREENTAEELLLISQKFNNKRKDIDEEYTQSVINLREREKVVTKSNINERIKIEKNFQKELRESTLSNTKRTLEWQKESINDELKLREMTTDKITQMVKSGQEEELKNLGLFKVELDKVLEEITSGQYIAMETSPITRRLLPVQEDLDASVEATKKAIDELVRYAERESMKVLTVMNLDEVSIDEMREKMQSMTAAIDQPAEMNLLNFQERIAASTEEVYKKFFKQYEILMDERKKLENEDIKITEEYYRNEVELLKNNTENKLQITLTSYETLMKEHDRSSSEFKKLDKERNEALTQIHVNHFFELVEIEKKKGAELIKTKEKWETERAELQEYRRDKELELWKKMYDEIDEYEQIMAGEDILSEIFEERREKYSNFVDAITNENERMSAIIIQNGKRVAQATSETFGQLAQLRQQDAYNMYAAAAIDGELTQDKINNIRRKEKEFKDFAKAQILIDSALAVGSTVVAAANAAKSAPPVPGAQIVAFAGTMASILPKVIGTFAQLKAITGQPSIVPDSPALSAGGGGGGFNPQGDTAPNFRGGLSGLSGDRETSGGGIIQGVIITDSQLSESEARRRFNVNRGTL